MRRRSTSTGDSVQAEGRLRRMTYGDGRFADMLIFGLDV
jgi:hypothetical protein